MIVEFFLFKIDGIICLMNDCIRQKLCAYDEGLKMISIWYFLFVVSLPWVALSHEECGAEHFLCDSGDQCIKRSKWCDKKSNCEDGSDETYCKKAGIFSWSYDPNGCDEKVNTHFKCNSAICIPVAGKCDGTNDCDDGSDEENCKNETFSTETTYSPYPYESYQTIVGNKFTVKNEISVRLISTSESSFPTTAITNRYDEVEQEPTTSISREASNGGRENDYISTSTSYYDMRMKEADSEIKPEAPHSPKAAPTEAYSARPSPSIPKSTSRPQSALPNVGRRQPSVSVNRPRSTHSPRSHQRQTSNRQTHSRQYPINHYQLSAQHQRPPFNHHQQNHYQPADHHSPSNRYPSPNSHHQSLSNRYQSHANNYQPFNGEPDVRSQSNYFKPFRTEMEVKKYFYFAKDYVALQGRANARSVREGQQWLLKQRTNTLDWGRDTPRAVVALALSNETFLKVGNNDDDILKRRFMIQLAADLLRNNTRYFNINRLSKAINGLLAVCEDPKDFHGIDLTEMLKNKIGEHVRDRSYLRPFVSLSLCLANKSLSSYEIHNLERQMITPVIMNERTKDVLSAAIMAFSCHLHQISSDGLRQQPAHQNMLRNAITALLGHMGDDGNFGSIYSTALAAQALMSTNETNQWNSEETMSFLKRQQREDGSFGDLLSTYWVLPALSGRSLLHLRNLRCNHLIRDATPQEILEWTGPKHYVHYSLFFGYPLVNSQSLYLSVPRGIHFLDVMRVAEYQNLNFRFTLEKNNPIIYSLSGLPNDPEMGLSWHLYVKQESDRHEPNSREEFTGDLRRLEPKSGEHFIFWYHSRELRDAIHH